MWVAETDPRSQSGCWQRFRESKRKQRERREAGGEREKEKDKLTNRTKKRMRETKSETMKGRNREMK